MKLASRRPPIQEALVAAAIALLLASAAPAQNLGFEAPSDPSGLEAKMPALANAALAQYREADERKRLDTLFRLQIVSGRWADADRSLAELHSRRATTGEPQDRAADVQYQILTRAKLIESKEGVSFESAFTRAFHEIMDPMDDRVSALVARAFEADRFPVGISLHVPIAETLNAELARAKGRSELSLPEA